MNPKVETYYDNLDKWQEESLALCKMVLDCGLDEDLKWGVPVYTWHNKNIVGINGFKACCALAFFKGALLSDPENILVQPGKVQAGRYIALTSVGQISEMEPFLKAYIFEAIEIERAGIKIIKTDDNVPEMPNDFQTRLNEFPALATAFYALTPGRQKAYIYYFSQAKQSKTREARIEKVLPKILKGKGLLD